MVGLEPEELRGVALDCGPGAVWFECDVTDPGALAEAVEGTVRRTGAIDVLIPNAGILVPGLIRSTDPEAFERTIDVNLLGVWRTVRSALPHLIESRGYILAVASTAAITPQFAGLSAYSASKAGVEAFAKALRAEVAYLGVDVGIGYFHWLDTDMVAAGDEVPGFAFLRSRLPGPLGKTYTIAAAAAAIVRGVERRAALVAAPWWVRGALALRGVTSPATTRLVMRSVPETAARYQANVPHEGAVGGPPEASG
ncbi:MAG: SDR family oxidoreductase [Thermoleophilaceae bacterium]